MSDPDPTRPNTEMWAQTARNARSYSWEALQAWEPRNAWFWAKVWYYANHKARL